MKVSVRQRKGYPSTLSQKRAIHPHCHRTVRLAPMHSWSSSNTALSTIQAVDAGSDVTIATVKWSFLVHSLGTAAPSSRLSQEPAREARSSSWTLFSSTRPIRWPRKSPLVLSRAITCVRSRADPMPLGLGANFPIPVGAHFLLLLAIAATLAPQCCSSRLSSSSTMAELKLSLPKRSIHRLPFSSCPLNVRVTGIYLRPVRACLRVSACRSL